MAFCKTGGGPLGKWGREDSFHWSWADVTLWIMPPGRSIFTQENIWKLEIWELTPLQLWAPWEVLVLLQTCTQLEECWCRAEKDGSAVALLAERRKARVAWSARERATWTGGLRGHCGGRSEAVRPSAEQLELVLTLLSVGTVERGPCCALRSSFSFCISALGGQRSRGQTRRWQWGSTWLFASVKGVSRSVFYLWN